MKSLERWSFDETLALLAVSDHSKMADEIEIRRYNLLITRSLGKVNEKYVISAYCFNITTHSNNFPKPEFRVMVKYACYTRRRSLTKGIIYNDKQYTPC